MGKGSKAKKAKLKQGSNFKPQPRAEISLSSNPWDTSPLTKTAGLNSVVEMADYADPETGKRVNPNGVRRRKRVSWLEVYKGRGLLTDKQVRAGLALQVAFERTQGSAPAIKKVNVDNSPKPDHAIEMILKRIGGFHSVMKNVPRGERLYILHVAMENRPLSEMSGCTKSSASRYVARLRRGLEALADNLGLA